MNASQQSLETKVGLFVLVGLVILAGMVVQFGRLGEGLNRTYPLTVQFSNASGVVRDAEVLLAGAKIGRVVEGPQILESGIGVSLKLKVVEQAKIPLNSTFHVASSGLLGDRFIDVRPPKEPGVEFIAPGAVIEGKRESGFDDITKEGTELIKDLRKAVERISGMLTRLDKDLLKESTFENLDRTVSNLKETSAKFTVAAESLNGVMEEAKVAAGKATSTLTEANHAMTEVRGAVGNADKAIEDARKTLAALEKAMVALTQGKGLVARLLTDSALADNLDALIENLRKGGVLFYRDRAGKEQPVQGSTPRPRSKARP